MPDVTSEKVPAAHFRQIQDESPTVDSAVKNIKAEYVSNPSQNGDACAAYNQMMAEVYAYKQKNGAEKTKQFVEEIGRQMPKEFGAEMDVAALRFVKEYEQYKKENPQADKSKGIARVQEDDLIKSLNQHLISQVPEQIRGQSPDQLGATLNALKAAARNGGHQKTSDTQYLDVPPLKDNRTTEENLSNGELSTKNNSVDRSRGWVKR